jgi:5-methyltetrahydrofolate--homocysteine methyltransferase
MTNLTTESNLTTFQQLQKIVENRIMVIDGAMGTMIQEYGLVEADYKGKKI